MVHLQGRRRLTDHFSHIRGLFEAAKDRALIISAYVGHAAVAQLLDASAAAEERAVYARWNIDDVASGASDWRVWDVADERNVPFFACPRLHAKMYVADNRALVGSANATGPGLGIVANANLEVLVEVDTSHTGVMGVIEAARETSALASPIGPDIADRQRTSQEEDDGLHVPIWLPKSDPGLFLRAMVGKGPHNDLSRQDRESVSLPPFASPSRAIIRKVLRDMTAFRIVRREFETRMTGMGISELRTLLASRVSANLAHLKDDDVVLLVRWLGQFGANTIATPSARAENLQLMPGTLLGSDDEFDD